MTFLLDVVDNVLVVVTNEAWAGGEGRVKVCQVMPESAADVDQGHAQPAEVWAELLGERAKARYGPESAEMRGIRHMLRRWRLGE